MITAIIILSILLLVSIYVCFNLFRKLETFEYALDSQDMLISKIQETIIFSKDKIKEIDKKETFKSDDEIGWFFENIKYIQDLINQFLIKQSDGQTK